MQTATVAPSTRVDEARAPTIGATATALPPHHYTQRDLVDVAGRLLPDLALQEGTLRRFFSRVGVEERYLALPADEYAALDGLASRSEAWLRVALPLGERCIAEVCHRAGVAPSEIALLASTTVTGLAVPSLEARLVQRAGLSPNVKRLPLFGLGCLGGAAGLARVSEYVRAFPDQLAVLLSVELCSLTLQRSDVSTTNVISAALFGDGAAAVLVAGAEHPLSRRPGRGRVSLAPHAPSLLRANGVHIVDTQSVVFANTERVMGWDMVDTGFKVVLDASLPELIERELPPLVDAFLGTHGLTRADMARWVSHPGGPAVLDAMERSLGLPPEALEASRRSLAEVGNLSSASVLRLLDEHLTRRRPAPGSHGLMLAMGPGFSAELLLLRW